MDLKIKIKELFMYVLYIILIYINTLFLGVKDGCVAISTLWCFKLWFRVGGIAFLRESFYALVYYCIVRPTFPWFVDDGYFWMFDNLVFFILWCPHMIIIFLRSFGLIDAIIEAILIEAKKRPAYRNPIVAIANGVHSMAIQLTIHALLVIPFFNNFSGAFIWRLLYILCSSIYWSFVSFEYKWCVMGESTQTGLDIFELNLPYYIGFGLPLTLISIFYDFPSGFRAPVMMALYPFWIMSALAVEIREPFKGMKKVPIFYCSNFFSYLARQVTARYKPTAKAAE